MTKIPTERFLEGIHDWQLDVLKDFDSGKWRFAMLNWHRRARKTTLAINLLIREACKYPNRRYVYVTSTFVAAKNIVWRDPNMLKAYLPDAVVKRKNETELFVELSNGSILSIHGSDKPDGLRGIDAHGVVIDEWAYVKRETWEEILRPIIAQNKERWAMFIFTPLGRNHAYEYWQRAKANDDWKTYELTADVSGIIPDEEIEKLRVEIPQRTFEQEMLCKFNADASTLFRGIDNCIAGELAGPKHGCSYVTGVDLAKYEDYTVLTTVCRETRQVVSFNRFNQVDWNLQKGRIIAESIKYNSQVCIDATGAGDPIVEDLRRAGLSVPDDGIIKLTHERKKNIIDRLIVSIEQRLITFPKIEEMIDELKAYSCELTPSGLIRYTAPQGLHDDCVISLSLAVHGMRNFLYSGQNRERPKPPRLITGSVY